MTAPITSIYIALSPKKKKKKNQYFLGKKVKIIKKKIYDNRGHFRLKALIKIFSSFETFFQFFCCCKRKENVLKTVKSQFAACYCSVE